MEPMILYGNPLHNPKLRTPLTWISPVLPLQVAATKLQAKTGCCSNQGPSILIPPIAPNSKRSQLWYTIVQRVNLEFIDLHRRPYALHIALTQCPKF